MTKRRGGLALGLGGVLVLSPDALMLRLMEADGAAIVAARALLTALVLGAFCLRRGGWRAFRADGVFAYGGFFAVGVACFPLSVQFTFGANTLVILASAPLLAALGARIFLGEHIARRTWLAALAALGGVGLIFSGGGQSADAAATAGIGADAGALLIGNLFALATAASIAGCSIVARRHHAVDTMPGIAVGAALAALVFAPLAEWTTITDRGADLALVLANGGLIMPLAFALINLASRILPPPEIGLIFLLEMALGPLWLALGASEIPPPPTIAAGALMAAIFVLHTAAARRAGSAAPPG